MPSIIGFVFSIILACRKNKTLAEHFMQMFLVVASLFFFFDGYTISPSAYTPIKMTGLIFNAFLAPCLGITICFICWSLSSTRQRYHRPYLSFYLIAFITFLVELMNFVGFGLERASELYDNNFIFPAECENDKILYHIYSMFLFFAQDVYNFVCAITFVTSFVFAIIMCARSDYNLVNWLKFIFCHGPLRVLHVWVMNLFLVYIFATLRIYYPSPYLVNNTDVALNLYLFGSLAMIGLGYVSLQLRKPCLYFIKRPHEIPVYEDLPVKIIEFNDADIESNQMKYGKEKVLSHYKNIVVSCTYITDDEREDMLRLMREQQCYLFPGQSRYYVAQILGMHRSALDHLFMSFCKLTYADYVEVQRVEYFRRYRRQFPNESEVAVSMACGFVSRKQMEFEIRECEQYFSRADKLNAVKQ